MPDDKPQPWHPADERKPGARRRGAPIGTHSFTGGSAEVGLPETPVAEAGAEPGQPRDAGREADLLKEPRAGGGGLVGGKR